MKLKSKVDENKLRTNWGWGIKKQKKRVTQFVSSKYRRNKKGIKYMTDILAVLTKSES